MCAGWGMGRRGQRERDKQKSQVDSLMNGELAVGLDLAALTS